jgi:hypothetical protein
MPGVPTWLWPGRDLSGRNPGGVVDDSATITQGSAWSATLGWRPESRWDSENEASRSKGGAGKSGSVDGAFERWQASERPRRSAPPKAVSPLAERDLPPQSMVAPG